MKADDVSTYDEYKALYPWTFKNRQMTGNISNKDIKQIMIDRISKSTQARHARSGIFTKDNFPDVSEARLKKL